MDIEEFQKSGFLQEANRLFFHPLGLALEVFVDDAEDYTLSSVWDCRDDPEGITFGSIDLKKVETVENLRKSKEEARSKLFKGQTIQPIK